jgi:hypothetical protein
MIPRPLCGVDSTPHASVKQPGNVTVAPGPSPQSAILTAKNCVSTPPQRLFLRQIEAIHGAAVLARRLLIIPVKVRMVKVVGTKNRTSLKGG